MHIHNAADRSITAARCTYIYYIYYYMSVKLNVQKNRNKFPEFFTDSFPSSAWERSRSKLRFERAALRMTSFRRVTAGNDVRHPPITDGATHEQAGSTLHWEGVESVLNIMDG